MNNKILFSIIAVAFVGGMFTVAYAGPMLPMITFAANTHTTGDADVDGNLNVDGTLTGILTLEGLISECDSSNGEVALYDLEGNWFCDKVTGQQIADESIFGGDIKDGEVTSADIADNTIIDSDLAPFSVGTQKIKDLAVGNQKIKNNAIDSAKILDGTIQGDDINTSTTIKANDFEYAKSKTRVISLSALGSTPNIVTTVNTFNNGVIIENSQNPASDARISKPVVLPDGATVTKITCWFFENHATVDVDYDCLLWGHDYVSKDPFNLAEVNLSTNGQSALGQSGFDNTIDNSLIDIENNLYYLVFISDPDGDCDSTCRIIGAQIEYEITNPD